MKELEQDRTERNIGVIGPWESIYGFGALGMALYPAESKEEAAKQLQICHEKKLPLIYMTEQYAKALQQEIGAFLEQTFPIVVPIPGISGNNGIGVDRIKAGVVQAIGADILFS